MRRHASSVFVLALLVATAAAFVATERLKLETVPVEATYVAKAISPVCRCPTSRAAIRFLVRRADTVTLYVVNARDQTVRVLAADRHLHRGRTTIVWNGRDANGRIVGDGTYRLRLQLIREGRTIEVPQAIVVDTVPPLARLVSFRPHVIAKGRRPRVVVTYTLSEPAHAVMFLDEVRRIETYSSARHGRFHWFARRAGRRLPPGRYRLQLAGIDAAGNLGPRTAPVIVRVH